MKITTWNVNGIRAAIDKGLLTWISETQPDVLCLQEIKARPEQLKDEHRNVDGYQIIWNPAMRPGYSGVATLLRVPAVKTETGMNEPRFDQEGRAIATHFEDFILFNIYFPNGQRDLARLTYKLDFYAHLLALCDALHKEGKKIIITGDFNTAHQEIDLANPAENSQNSGFLPEERLWIDHYLDHGFKDVYRELYPDRVQYTWWTYRFNARLRNIGWRLDYFLVSDDLVSRVEDVIIDDQVAGSDHCPVTLLLK
jgi:exodeoxyribonuclease-3